MTIKLAAAFHEAGHAVASHYSRFHRIVGPIHLSEYGSGEMYISLSKSKLVANGVPLTPSSAENVDVAIDLAIVLSAGLVSEQIAESLEQGITANPQCAAQDHQLLQQQLAVAGLSTNFDMNEKQARQLLEEEWSLVVALATYLLERVSVGPMDVISLIEQHQKCGTAAQPIN